MYLLTRTQAEKAPLLRVKEGALSLRENPMNADLCIALAHITDLNHIVPVRFYRILITLCSYNTKINQLIGLKRDFLIVKF